MGNNPINFNDPTGHVRDESGCRTIGCSLSQKQKDEAAGNEAEIKKQSHERKCAAGNNNYCSGWSKKSRPVSGVHIGWSGQTGWIVEPGVYGQQDYVVDWRKGDIYVVRTIGGSVNLGSPTGMEGTAYFGTTNVKGIPANSTYEDMVAYLSGPQIDASVSANLDAGLLAGVEKGVSVDWNTKTNSPVYTPHVGYMYTVENSIQIGGNAVPNGFDFNFEGGASESFVVGYIDLW